MQMEVEMEKEVRRMPFIFPKAITMTGQCQDLRAFVKGCLSLTLAMYECCVCVCVMHAITLASNISMHVQI